MTDMLLVTNWEEVDPDDFYLTDDWLIKCQGLTKNEARKLRKLAREKGLSIGYEVPATSFAIYVQMDAHQVLINDDGDVLVNCESEVIDTDFREKWKIEGY